jgi:hypothetical protein
VSGVARSAARVVCAVAAAALGARWARRVVVEYRDFSRELDALRH